MQDQVMTPMLVFAIFSSVLGMFQFGFNTGVPNAPQKVLEEFIANIYRTRNGQWLSEELRDLIWAIVVSIFAIGGMIGAVIAPSIANHLGRKTGLLLNNTIAVLGVALMSSSQLMQSYETLALGRLIIGVSCGLNTALVPMYVSEIAPVNARGFVGTLSQLGVTIGLLISQILGLKELLGTKDHWPFLFGVAFIPAILQLVTLPFCPESPRYLLISRGRVSEARYALRRLRQTTNIEDDIEEMMAEEQAQQEEIEKYGKLTSITDLLLTPWLRKPLLIGVLMQMSQQLSGINAIFNYSTKIFMSADIDEAYASKSTLGVGVVMVIMTLVSIPLMDKQGRKTLHLWGLSGMFLASIFLTISLLVKFLYDWMKYISVISILVYTVFFAIGPGSIPWIITAELFTQGTRPVAMSVTVLVNWLMNFVVGLFFPFMMTSLQNYLFLPFTLSLAIFYFLLKAWLPETKNRTFEEIAAQFRPINTDGNNGTGLNYASTSEVLKGIQDLHKAQASAGSLNTSNNLEGSPANVAGNFRASDRFRFEPPGVGPTTSGGPNGAPMGHHNNHGYVMHENASYQHQDSNPNLRESQGNIDNILAHNSCTSIAQNSYITSDQQPLIVDTQLDRCRYHDDNRMMLRNPLTTSSMMMKPVASSNCYVKTTSFMERRNQNTNNNLHNPIRHHLKHQHHNEDPQSNLDCLGCRQVARAGSSSNLNRVANYSSANTCGYPVDMKHLGNGQGDTDGALMGLRGADEPILRSRTLTRTQRPLSETAMGAPSLSSYNLTELAQVWTANADA